MSEQERAPRLYSSIQDKVGFGKYRDLTLEEAYTRDVNYLRWAVEAEAIDADCFKTLFGETDDSMSRKKIYLDSVVWFGQYKGKTFGEVCAEDREYAEWVLGEEGFLEYAEGNDPANSVNKATQNIAQVAPAQPTPAIPPAV